MSIAIPLPPRLRLQSPSRYCHLLRMITISHWMLEIGAIWSSFAVCDHNLASVGRFWCPLVFASHVLRHHLSQVRDQHRLLFNLQIDIFLFCTHDTCTFSRQFHNNSIQSKCSNCVVLYDMSLVTERFSTGIILGDRPITSTPLA